MGDLVVVTRHSIRTRGPVIPEDSKFSGAGASPNDRRMKKIHQKEWSPWVARIDGKGTTFRFKDQKYEFDRHFCPSSTYRSSDDQVFTTWRVLGAGLYEFRNLRTRVVNNRVGSMLEEAEWQRLSSAAETELGWTLPTLKVRWRHAEDCSEQHHPCDCPESLAHIYESGFLLISSASIKRVGKEEVPKLLDPIYRLAALAEESDDV